MKAPAMVVCSNLKKNFGTNEILRGITIAVERGEVLGLIGASGSGKSTLLRCMNFLEAPSAGEVLVDGEVLGYKDRSGRRVRRRERELDAQRAEIGMVFQAYNLWPHMSVIKNVIEAPIRVRKLSRATAVEQGMSLLKKVGLADKADSPPGTLSGGQQQRVAIARALAMEPKLLLLDEVTSALDPELVGEVLSTIRLLAEEGMTMVIVSHEMGFIKEVANRVAFLDQGRVCEVGDARQVLVEPKDPRTQAFLARVLE